MVFLFLRRIRYYGSLTWQEAQYYSAAHSLFPGGMGGENQKDESMRAPGLR